MLRCPSARHFTPLVPIPFSLDSNQRETELNLISWMKVEPVQVWQLHSLEGDEDVNCADLERMLGLEHGLVSLDLRRGGKITGRRTFNRQRPTSRA